MANNIFNDALRRILAAYVTGTDIRARLLMTNTTADTEKDAIVNIADLTTVDVCDATGYADVALANEAVAADDPNDRAEFDADNISFTGLGGDATRDVQGCLIYEYVDGTDANDIVLFFIDFTADIPSSATQIDVPFDAEGILQAAQG